MGGPAVEAQWEVFRNETRALGSVGSLAGMAGAFSPDSSPGLLSATVYPPDKAQFSGQDTIRPGVGVSGPVTSWGGGKGRKRG